ncbi:hypothetical protein [Streptomyces paludis]|uniref:Uncharacterized protein n=1 Tax=Streptomyces paludis TaxID=2282738 RepID=A0A345HKW3_9ACTN|nr:hypothetical protein [Streptomyces paludis]AXG77337.1 hypothetical protein DVK44_06125 [Streptomyces paludis]
MTHTTVSTRTRKRRVASAIGVLVAVIGMTAGTAGIASAAEAPTRTCIISVGYEGKWISISYKC